MLLDTGQEKGLCAPPVIPNLELALGKGLNLVDPKNEKWRLDWVSKLQGNCRLESQLDQEHNTKRADSCPRETS